MLKFSNSLGKKSEPFTPAHNNAVTIFTCGPSIYQRAHIGNFRTFLFEDILVRYLLYSGYRVERGMNFTDIEDKAIAEASAHGLTLKELTDRNIADFLNELSLLKIRTPEYMPRASDYIDQTAAMIARLLELGIAYSYKGNIYFDPMKFPGFGKLYGLDLTRWPRKKKRFHQDTYPGIQWNLGDFILWHGYRPGDQVSWETAIGRGRPSWNIQDPCMVASHFTETLSIYCGGIDNLYRHHDYSIAILESLRPYPMARFWLHGGHLLVKGRKMSKSKGNILYIEHLIERGYSATEIRFFLIDGHYREHLSYTDEAMERAAVRLRSLRQQAGIILKKAGRAEPQMDGRTKKLKRAFQEAMDENLCVCAAVNRLLVEMEAAAAADISPEAASALKLSLQEIDEVLEVIF